MSVPINKYAITHRNNKNAAHTIAHMKKITLLTVIGIVLIIVDLPETRTKKYNAIA